MLVLRQSLGEAAAQAKPFTVGPEHNCHGLETGGLDTVNESELDASFHHDLQCILDAVDLDIDQRLDRLIGLLNRREPALLARAEEWTDQEIARAFLEFVNPADQLRANREARLLGALVGAAEFKKRAGRAGLTALQYAHLLRVRRELGDD